MGIVALLLMGAFVCCPFVSDDSDADEAAVTINVEAASDFCGTSKTVKYTLSGDGIYYYKLDLLNDSDSSTGSMTSKSGYLAGSGPYTATTTVTAPSISGDYMFVAKFYKDNSDDAELLAEKSVPLKVVDPIVLKFTLKNEGDVAVDFTAYFKINGEKVEDSVQSVTVPANGTKDVTYNYYVRDVEDTTYSLWTDDAIVNHSIEGLEVEETFYAHDSDYSLITTIVVVALIALLVVFYFIYRKPVVNKGKPKGRR